LIPGEPELTAKNFPAPKIKSNFERYKRLAKQCMRCGVMFITDLHTQYYCPTCRGGEMGRDAGRRLMDSYVHGVPIPEILEDMRR